MVARYIGCMAQPTLGGVTFLFARIGNLTFGGGDPTMAAIYREVVERRRWLSAENYGLIFSLARITPGTNVLAFCAGMGWRLAGIWGAILAVAVMTLPSAVLVVWLTVAYQRLQVNVWAMAAIAGILAAVVGMMASGAWQILRPHVRPGNYVRAVSIPAAAFLLASVLQWQPIVILAVGAVVGLIWRAPDPK